MISCLYPECNRRVPVDEHGDIEDIEIAKRAVIDHINAEHDDAHVLIPCHHELKEVERVNLTTRDGNTGQPVEVEVVKSECVRCGQGVTESAPIVTVVQDETGHDVLQIPEGA